MRYLMLEDDPNDAELVEHALREAGLDGEIVRVDDMPSFKRHIESGKFDVVLADYRLPRASGIDALQHARALDIDLPFIIVTGTLGDEQAIEVLKLGATDYVLKQHVARLPRVVRRAVAEAEERRRCRIAEEQRDSFYSLSPDLFCIVDSDLRVLDINPAWETVLGYSRDEITTGTYTGLLHPDDLAPTLEVVRQIQSGRVARNFDTRYRTKSGSYLSIQWSAAFDAKRRRIFFVGRDVSDVKRVDEALRASETKLRQAQKMEAVGRLAGGVAHDFNNVLTAILGFAQLGEDECDAGEQLCHYFVEIRKAGVRAADVTRQLLAFGRRQMLTPRVLDPNEVLSTIAPLLRRLLGEDITMTLELAPELGLIEVDPSQLDQVIVNLVVNARDALPGGGTIEIATSNAAPDPARVAPGLEIRSTAYVSISVRDDGSGITAETMSKIFEPFFTTKAPGRGTGLGLATVYGIVEQSGGVICITTEVGKGSKFDVYFPRAADKKARAKRAARVERKVDGNETILVVEDDDAIRALVLAVLAQHGYRVLEASNRSEALAEVQRHDQRIDLLLTDVVMPEGSGNTLATELVASRRIARVLFMSGFAGHPLVEESQRTPGGVFLSKPFTPDQLLRGVRSVLDAVRN